MITVQLAIEINEEMERAMAKWGTIDETPREMTNAVAEELLEVIHAVNHRKPYETIHTEIIQAIGVLLRLDALAKG